MVRLVPENFRDFNKKREIDRDQLMTVLANVTHLLIRANYNSAKRALYRYVLRERESSWGGSLISSSCIKNDVFSVQYILLDYFKSTANGTGCLKKYFYYNFSEDVRTVVRDKHALVGGHLEVRIGNLQGGFLRNA